MDSDSEQTLWAYWRSPSACSLQSSRQAPSHGGDEYPCGCPRTWDVTNHKMVITTHYCKRPTDDWYIYRYCVIEVEEDDTSDSLCKLLDETRLFETKLHRACTRDISRVKRTRSRREHVGKHNWYHAWYPMPGTVQPKVCRREREAIGVAPCAMAASQWQKTENKGDRRTAARMMHWKTKHCSCVHCADMYWSMLNSYTRLQKANMQKLARRYQAASNGMHQGVIASQNVSARKWSDWTDYAWELALEYPDREDDLPDVEYIDNESSSVSDHSVNLLQLLKPSRRAKKQGEWLTNTANLTLRPSISRQAFVLATS